jgi:hypothetical protein
MFTFVVSPIEFHMVKFSGLGTNEILTIIDFKH